MKIHVITLYMGRARYLKDSLAALAEGLWTAGKSMVTVHVICQGQPLPKMMLGYLHDHLMITELPENIGIGLGLKFAQTEAPLDADLVMKLDEDAIIRSPNFFSVAVDIARALGAPDQPVAFSPFPVGLIDNLAGPPIAPHQTRRVIHVPRTDTYYTLRPVIHLGGLARIMSGSLFREFPFKDDRVPGRSGDEDGQVSRWLLSRQVSMYYLENGLIVEHQESTLGQHARYGDAYFQGRR